MSDFIKIKMIDAAKNNDMSELEFCLGVSNIDINGTNAAGVTALLAACLEGNVQIVERLLKIPNIDVNKSAKDKKTPLFVSCQRGDVPIVTMLMAHPEIDVNCQDKFSNSAFMVALRSKFDAILAMFMVHKNFNINQAKKDGTTPLMFAVGLDHVKLVKEMLDRDDVDTSLKNNKDQTAYDIAKSRNQSGMLKVFEQKATANVGYGATMKRPKSTGTAKTNKYEQFLRQSSFMSGSFDGGNTNTEAGNIAKRLVKQASANGAAFATYKDKISRQKRSKEQLTRLDRSFGSFGVLGSSRTEIYNVCVIGEDEVATSLIKTLESQHFSVLPLATFEETIALDELFKQVDKSTTIVCVVPDEGFFKKKLNIASLVRAASQNKRVFGLCVDPNVFKAAQKLGENILSPAIWEQLREVEITYPDVFDALELLSKNQSVKQDDLISKIEA